MCFNYHEFTHKKHMEYFKDNIDDILDRTFDIKEKIPQGVYLDIMDGCQNANETLENVDRWDYREYKYICKTINKNIDQSLYLINNMEKSTTNCEFSRSEGDSRGGWAYSFYVKRKNDTLKQN